jgi:segregation and condensation protein B
MNEPGPGLDRRACVEAVLFVSGEPLVLGEIARALACTEDEAAAAVEDLQGCLDRRGSGLQVVSIAGGYQMCTKPALSEIVGRLLTREAGRLSRAALETIAIIAYRQPVTQPEVEAVRGVGCSSVLRTLIERDLIREAGRRPTPGRPILYATTQSFLHYFALRDLSELPQLDATGVQEPDGSEPGEA